jgi:predicted dehydrogenase
MGFKICVIGCGGIASGYHGPSYAKYVAENPGVELTACCDIVQEKVDSFAERFGFTRTYRNYVEMLEKEKPDAVCLNVPPTLTCQLTCVILRMRYPLLLEKPPGVTVDEIDQMIAVANQYGVPNQVAFNRRYTPLVVALKRMLSERQNPDEIQHIRYDFSRIGRTDDDFSTTAIHGIDTASFIAGSAYAQVKFHYQEFPNLGPTTANIFMDCTFASGVTAHLNFTPVSGAVLERATVHALNHLYGLHLPVWDAFDVPGRLFHLEKGNLVEDVTGPQVSGGEENFILNGFSQEDAAFFDDIRAGRFPQGSLETGRQVVEIAQCIRERRGEYRGDNG